MEIFSNHHDFFICESFDNRPVIVYKEDIELETIECLETYYESEFSPHPYLENISSLMNILYGLFIKTIMKIPESELEKIIKAKTKDIEKIYPLKDFLEDFFEGNADELKTLMKEVSVENSDYFTIANLMPLMTLEIIKKVDNCNIDKDLIKKIFGTGIIYPVLSAFICPNTAHSLFNPPFFGYFFPHMVVPETIKCPIDNTDTLKVKLFGFNPHISRRIMKNGGFFPYIFAYILYKNEIVFDCNAYLGSSNEIDFIISKNDMQFYVEVKCVNKKQGKEGFSINDKMKTGVEQIKRNIEKINEAEELEFHKKILLINYKQSQIEETCNKKSYIKYYKSLEKEGICIIGYDNINHIFDLLE